MTSPAIAVANLSKSFQRYDPHRPWSIQEVLARGFQRMKPIERFWALRDVSFSVSRGRTVGIVGANGSGKSTLLRLIGGVGRPDSGSVVVRGSIGALLDLGAGFHPDLTGRENAIMSGILSGLTKREVIKRLEAIVAYAEVEKFIDHPIRTYSTGMQMRLAFSAAVHAEPEVLIIDEVLSVGDIAFQRKCLDRIAQFRKAGCSILLVSHEASVVQDLCDEVLWVNAGRLMAQGPAFDVLGQYAAHMGVGAEPVAVASEARSSSPSATHPTVITEQGVRVTLDENRFGSEELGIAAVRVLDGDGRLVTALPSGQPLRIEIDYRATRRVVAPLFRVRILRDDGLLCYDINTEMSSLSLEAFEGRGRVTLLLERLDLSNGRYTIDVGCYSQDRAYTYDYDAAVHSLVIHGSGVNDAVLSTPCKWAVELGVADLTAPDQAVGVKRQF